MRMVAIEDVTKSNSVILDIRVEKKIFIATFGIQEYYLY